MPEITIPEIEITVLENLDFEIPCEVNGRSTHHEPPHAADMAVLKDCGCTIHVCEMWFYAMTKLQQVNGWIGWCIQCKATRIRYVHSIPIRGRS